MNQPFDPYAPPRTHDVPPPVVDGPRPRLFSPGQVGVASVLGSALAGGFLLALNDRSLGRSFVGKPLMVSGAIFLAVMAAGFVLPPNVPSIVFALAQYFGMKAYAQATQGALYIEHQQTGGLRGSNWVVFGAIVGAVVIAMSLGMGVVYAFDLEV